MSLFSRKNRRFLIISFIALAFFGVQTVNAGLDDNVSGWAWSENIGWISFNNITGGGPIDYGVEISTSTGIFSGYAWSENIGWISFERNDTGTPPASPYNGSEDFIAKLDLETNEVSGWAKALSIDSWIKLRDTTYGVERDISTTPDELKGWAWSDQVIGWISFNSITGGGPTQYAVVVDMDTINPEVESFNIVPSTNWVSSTITISWSVSDEEGGSYLKHVEAWRALDNNGSPGAWSQIGDNYDAPMAYSWTSSVDHSSSDYLQDGTWWYGIHVLDNAGNVGTESNSDPPLVPIKIQVDFTEPVSYIESPDAESWHNDDGFTITLQDGDSESGLSFCEYKVISGGISTGWSSRTCGADLNITVGSEPGKDCGYQGSDEINACWVYIRSKDIAGNDSDVSVRRYNIDWTQPLVGEISPLTAIANESVTFTASLIDPFGVIDRCWLYIDGYKGEIPSISPGYCADGNNCTVSVDYTFSLPGSYSPTQFICRDEARNATSGDSVTIIVDESMGNQPPVISAFATSTTGCLEPTIQSECFVNFNITAFDPEGENLTYEWDFEPDTTIDSTNEDTSHHYDIANTYMPTVYVFDGVNTTQRSTEVIVSDPTISVSLVADPSFGINSLSNVDLSAIISGSMAGTVNYEFDCNNDGTLETKYDGIDLSVSDPDWVERIDFYSNSFYTKIIAPPTNSFAIKDICSYGSVGDYISKVFVQRGEGSAEDTANINVVASECDPNIPEQTNCTSPQGCSHTIVCQPDGTWPSCPTDECVKDSVRNCDNCGEQTCLSTCQWGSCEGQGECAVGPDCPDCLCAPDVCVGQDYYDYPDFGDCNTNCFCDIGTDSGEPCDPNIIVDALQCNEAPVCDSLSTNPDQGAAPLNVLFTASAHDNDGTITQYEFDFGDGSPFITGSESVVEYTYNDSGDYCAKLRVQDDDGVWSEFAQDCSGVCAQEVNVIPNQPPIASVACDGSGCGSGSLCNDSWVAYNRNCDFYFLNQSTDPNSTNPPDDNDDIIKSTWSIFYQGGTPWQNPYIICNDDDQTQGNEAICDILMPLLPASENYYVTLTVEDKVEVTDQQSKSFYVKSEIAADFQCSSAEGGWQSCDGFVVSEGEVVQFQDTTIISEGAIGISSWSWTFEDGDPDTSNIQNPLASFINIDGNSGTVTLEVTDNAGRTDTQSYRLQITIPLPEWYEVTPF